MRQELQTFIEHVPWLAELDGTILERLEVEEWHLPTDGLAQRRSELEATLPAHIMTYRREAQGLKDTLGAILEPAELTPEQMALLREVEEAALDCLLVAFAKPLRRRPGLGAGARRASRRRARVGREIVSAAEQDAGDGSKQR